MATTITDGVTTITLPDDLVWSNEFHTTQIAQDTKRSLTGAFVVFEDTKLHGRSIKLDSDEDSGWIIRSNLLALRALSEQEDMDMTLVFHAQTHTVRFDRANGSPIKTVQILECSDPSNDAKYALSLSLITV